MKISIDTNGKTLDEVLEQLKEFVSDKLDENEILSGVQTFYLRQDGNKNEKTYFLADEERTDKLYEKYKPIMDNAVLELQKYLFDLEKQKNELEHRISLDESYLATAEKLGRDKINISRRKAYLTERKAKLRSVVSDYENIDANLKAKTYLCWAKNSKVCNVVLFGRKNYVGFNATSKKLFTYSCNWQFSAIANAVLVCADAIIGDFDCIRYYKKKNDEVAK